MSRVRLAKGGGSLFLARNLGEGGRAHDDGRLGLFRLGFAGFLVAAHLTLGHHSLSRRPPPGRRGRALRVTLQEGMGGAYGNREAWTIDVASDQMRAIVVRRRICTSSQKERSTGGVAFRAPTHT